MYELIEQMHAKANSVQKPVGFLFEKAVEAIYTLYLKPGDKAIDVGAHKGAHLFPMAKAVGDYGKIIGFEPIPRLHNKLVKAVKRQKLKQVVLHNVAIGLQRGNVSFSYFEKHPAYSGLQTRQTHFDEADVGLTEITVMCKRLDMFRPLFDRINFIKLDIEGGELNALQSGYKLVTKSRPLIIFENGKQQSATTYSYTKDDFFGFFESLDYKLFVLSGESFSREDWAKPQGCWEFVAIPKEEQAFAEYLPDFIREVLAGS